MQNFLIAAALLGLGYYVLKAFGKSTPKQSSALIRKLGGAACIGFAAFMAMRGNLAVAAPLALFGAGLWGLTVDLPWLNRGGGAGQASRVTTVMLAMELEHATGRMDGMVLGGSLKGRRVSSLKDAELKVLWSECGAVSDQSRPLLAAWLDRNRAGWRTAWGGNAGRSGPAAATGRMGRDEALAVLGLKPGAAADDIRAAHRRLIKGFHPDIGGSDYLAAKINEAKAVLLQD